jgi:hypothetical protein
MPLRGEELEVSCYGLLGGGGIFGCSELGAGCSKDGLGQDVSATARSGQDARAPLKKWRLRRADLWDKGPCLRGSGFFVFPQ